jgi:hypothetical protein
MPLPFELLQVTAAYSNAVLVAIMPHVSGFAQKLGLPIPQPINESQVANFRCSPRTDHIGGRVTLTNGCRFIFDDGGIRSYESAHSFYSVQDPSAVPQFFGTVNLSEPDAVDRAHEALQRLGYSDALLSTDRTPQVIPPPVVKGNEVPRYRIRWFDPTRGHDPNNPPLSAECEVNATTGEIEMLNILNPGAWRPAPEISVHPPVVGGNPATVYGNGRKIYPVSETYSNAFLTAILPQCTAYAKAIGYPLNHSLTLRDVIGEKNVCGLVDNDPMASVNLKNGVHFDYRHGQVIAFYAPDVMELPGRENPHSPLEFEKFQAQFFGPINLTQDEAVALVRQTVENLGYSQQVLHIEKKPRVWGPNWWGTNHIARCSMQWKDTEREMIQVQAEVDLATKSVKSLYINDHANTDIWRTPPHIDVPPN